MKKIVSFLLSAVLVFSLAACSTQDSQNSSSNEGEVTESPDVSPEPDTETSEESSAETAAGEAGGTLVAYFSWSGNTEQMARMIQEETGADLFEIEPAEPYTDDYDALLDVARQEQADSSRPEVASQVENWDSYDVVFVGYPKMEQGFFSV